MATRVILKCDRDGGGTVHTEVDNKQADPVCCPRDTVAAVAEAFRRMAQLGTTELVCTGADFAAGVLENLELAANDRRD